MIRRRLLPNPYYEGVATIVLTDTATGKVQAFGTWGWSDKSYGERFALMRRHIRALLAPYPAWTAPEVQFKRKSRDDDPRDAAWS